MSESVNPVEHLLSRAFYQAGGVMADAMGKTGVQIGSPASDQKLADIDRKLDALISGASSKPVTEQNNKVVSPVVIPQTRVITEEPIDLANIKGMDCKTGQTISGIAYLKQRINDALSTIRASQVVLRLRGGDLYKLKDQRMSPTGKMQTIGAIAYILTHELAGLPDYTIKRIQISDEQPENGEFGFTLNGYWLGNEVEVSV